MFAVVNICYCLKSFAIDSNHILLFFVRAALCVSGFEVNVIEAFRFLSSLGIGSGLTPQTCFIYFKLVRRHLSISSTMHIPFFSRAAIFDLRFGAKVMTVMSIPKSDTMLLRKTDLSLPAVLQLPCLVEFCSVIWY